MAKDEAPAEETRSGPARASRWPVWAALTAIVALGASLRLYHLGLRSLWMDEAQAVYLADFAKAGLRLLDPDYVMDPPLLPFLLHGWIALVYALSGARAGSAWHDILLRLLPCLVSIATIPAVFAAARALLRDRVAALAAALLFALSPMQVYYAQNLRSYSLLVALGTLALWLFAGALDEGRVRHWLGWTLCVTAGLYTHYSMVWILLCFGLAYAATWRSHRHPRLPFAASVVGVLVLSWPALRLGAFVLSVVYYAQDPWFPQPTARIVLLTVKSFFAGYTPRAGVYAVLLLLAVGLTAAGLYALRRRPHAAAPLAILGLGPMVLAAFYWGMHDFPYYTHRGMLYCAVPLYILTAQGLRVLRRPLAVAGLGAMACLMAVSLSDHYRTVLHPQPVHRLGVFRPVAHREAAAFVAERRREGDAIGHRTLHTLPPARYYLDDRTTRQRVLVFRQEESDGLTRGYPHPPLSKNLDLLPERIETFVSGAPRIWYYKGFHDNRPRDPEAELAVAWLDGHLIRELRQAFDGVTVYLYRNEPDLVAHTPTCRLADSGDFSLPYYLFRQDAEDLPAVREWRRSFLHMLQQVSEQRPTGHTVSFGSTTIDAAQAPPLYGQLRVGDADCTVLAVDEAAGRAHVFAFPVAAEDAFAYQFTISNGPTDLRLFEYSVIESTAMLDALSFTRQNVESDVWRPALMGDPRVLGTANGTCVLAARLGEATDASGPVYRDVDVAPGRYAVWVQCMLAPDLVEWKRAVLAIAVASGGEDGTWSAPRAVGVLEPVSGVPIAEWGWRRVGVFDSPTGSIRMYAEALNDRALPEAYFDLARVALVYQGDSGEERPLVIEKDRVRLHAGAQAQRVRTGRLDGDPVKRVDIEVLDPVVGEMRRIHFQVRRAGG